MISSAEKRRSPVLSVTPCKRKVLRDEVKSERLASAKMFAGHMTQFSIQQTRCDTRSSMLLSSAFIQLYAAGASVGMKRFFVVFFSRSAVNRKKQYIHFLNLCYNEHSNILCKTSDAPENPFLAICVKRGWQADRLLKERI